ncbi:MAG: RNA polymerase sigma factor [Bacteroidota bacterium]|nr:RNA polymerase sigma factor [Bacteroidota bacterium]
MNAITFKINILPLNKKLYKFAFAILNNSQEAEDVVQDVFIKLWNLRNKLDSYKSIEAFAMSITKNLCIDKIRLKKTIQLDEKSYGDFSEIQYQADTTNENNKTIEIIHKSIKSLPEQQRIIMQLKDIDGYDYEEISQIMKMNINSIRVCISRARKKIREIIVKNNYEQASRNKKIVR